MNMQNPVSSSALPFAVPSSRWDDGVAATLSPAELLLYRSNLLGSDLTVTNFGGGNTSAKIVETDPLTGEKVEVLWVKGSGGDIGSMKLDGFSTLYQEKLLGLEKHYGGPDDDDKMVGYLPHCTFNLNPRAASIDTPLHSLLPFAHVDHVHPDAIIALAASSGGEAATKEIWGGKIGWLPWKRPGYTLGVQLRDFVRANPGVEGVMLAGHGIICWADTAKSCYEHTVQLIADAAEYLNAKLAEKPAFGGQVVAPNTDRAAIAADLMPRLRGLMTGARVKVGHYSDDAEALEFVGSADFLRLAALGTSCPDHFLRTKIAPLPLDPAKLQDDAYLADQIAAYRDLYAAYYERCKRSNSPAMRDANPIVILVPGVGRITFAGDKTTARLAGEFYGNAINVMRGAEAIGEYIALDEQEAFDIEYWLLEEAKLQRMPKPKPLVGKIALVTGGAGGIGAATAARLLADGACVMLADRDANAIEEVRSGFAKQFGKDVIRAAVCDVTDEAQVQAAFDDCAREFGGLDILVANAGIASSAPIEETTVALWRKNYDVLAEGYFLTARAAFPLMKRMKEQGGASIVFIGSKNGVAAATNASAYASAKAAANHLARCLALEGAPFGIRVNTVNPDAVIKGSKIWDGDWRKERAGAHGIDSGKELEEHYRQRSMLKRDVLPSDIAEAVYFLAGDMSAKSTGNMINVDAGNAQAFTR
ncbi:bifunctional rhamnulose-1-phosphate aldolase/short-chain dehydrogenase [Sphingomonadales bacterium 56]|uniref:bifunctional rhamnulose-1-phosphate aldolase/short-chain dehydrogenase n=1 Tax=unclassified Sphingobium TaxID=2611147 RepID=UPI00191996B7|nr:MULTISPECIES: bifunctional rhamnulose-1-phosphate aldolase/short-chain dehydrogenase [unclassified Sphingobium]MBY2929657.1 bifunctional rhamnulose-1-phosphate aldolase/short-chain dehydrogenase [Sphingomonadales bacterium 56]MBY2960160.1 bifunctional rhamnulose-1-phosphate aldolase/short-chain dehydrogenase [Sphingomonadales bacterium 58]